MCYCKKSNKPKREYGYYWIKRPNLDWEIARWDDTHAGDGLNAWFVCGDQYAQFDTDIDDVGVMVIPLYDNDNGG